MAVNPFAQQVKLAQSAVQTPAQIQAAANQQALANEAATLAAQKAKSEQIISQYNNQADRAQGFAGALGAIGAGQDEQAQARYTTAANTLAGLGTGLTGAVGDAYQQQIDAAKATIAQITGGYGDVTAPSAQGMTNASNYAGVVVPSTTLAADAVNAARQAATDAARRSQNVDIIGQGYRDQANAAIGQQASDARALIAQRPKSIADLVQQLTQNRQTAITNLTNTIGMRADYAQKQVANQIARQAQALAAHNALLANRLATNEFAFTKTQARITNKRADRTADQADRTIDISEKSLLQAGAAQMGYDANGNPTFDTIESNRTYQQQQLELAQNQADGTGYLWEWKNKKLVPQRDAKGRLIPTAGYRLTPNGQGVVAKPKAATKAGSASAATGGLTPDQWQDTVITAREEAKKARDGVEPGKRYIDPEFDAEGNAIEGTGRWIDDKNAPGTPGAPYSEVLTQLLTINSTPAWRRKAFEIAGGLFPEGTSDRGWDNPQAAARDFVLGAKKLGWRWSRALEAAERNNLPIPLVQALLKRLYPAGDKDMSGVNMDPDA